MDDRRALLIGALVVDDDDDILQLLAMLLRRNGYLVDTASSAFEAIEKFTSGDFCLVLSDIGMPGMNGYELARKLRALPGCKVTVLIAITAMTIPGDRDRALHAGFDDLIRKPVGAQTLMAAIERLRKKKTGDR